MTTPICVGIFGQSLASQILAHPGIDVVKAQFARSGYDATVLGYASGGASILKSRATPSTNYWWDEDSNTPGPVLTAAIAAINSWPVKPTCFVMQEGEGDAAAGGTFGPTEAANFAYAYSQVVWRLRLACAGGNSTLAAGIKTAMQFITRWTQGPCAAVQGVREAQVAYDNAYSTQFGYDTFDLQVFGDDPLQTSEIGDRHPDTIAQGDEAWRFVQCCLDMMGDTDARMPPQAGTVVRSGATIRVPIVGVYGFTKPDNPGHYAIRTGTTVVEADACTSSWDGDTLVITPPTAPVAGAQFLYPYGEMATVHRERLIFDPHGAPLRTLVRTLA